MRAIQPDPKRPPLESVALLEPDQLTPLDGGGVLLLGLIRIRCGVRHASPWCSGAG